jgi:thioredoxin 1
MKAALTDTRAQAAALDQVLSSVSIVKASADWCGPCRKMDPLFDELAAASGLQAFRLDVDLAEPQGGDAADLLTRMRVSALPCFVLFNDGKEVQRLVGADADKLAELFGRATCI